MKILITILEFVFLFSSSWMPSRQQQVLTALSYPIRYQNLGNPLMEHYPENTHSRCPWDIEIYDNKVFVGGGDYDKNTGPVPVYYYDIISEQWVYSGQVPDEQIEQFKVINNTLTIPGCDPRDDWNWGNLYHFQNNQWEINRSIPGGIHQFDVVEYENLIFVGLGVNPGEYPIAISSDQGKTFKQVPMYKNNVPNNTNIPDDGSVTSALIRVYEFFELKGVLYAYYCYYTNNSASLEIYQYRDGAFHYTCDLPGNIKAKPLKYRTFQADVEHKGYVYFTTGNLYISEDMRSANKITLSENGIVSDLRIINDRLYALVTSADADGQYRTSVWVKTNSSDSSFLEVFHFQFPCPALSFTYQNGIFYFGMGHGIQMDGCDHCGSILASKAML